MEDAAWSACVTPGSQERLSPALLVAMSLHDPPQASANEAGLAGVPAAAAAGAAAEDSGSASADEMTCSICLQHTELEEIAGVKGCDHTYCVKCILRWAAHRDTATCPQCKAPFDYLLTYYRLDGTLSDFPCEESVCLLKRARFFTDHMQTVEQGRWKLSADDGSSEWRDYEPFFQEYDDDEAVENYYFSAAAGRARITLGNRRFGENGFVSSGRSYARPARTPPAQGKKKGGVAAGPSPKPSPPPAPTGAGRRRKGKGGAAPAPASATGPSSGGGNTAGGNGAASSAAAARPLAARRSSQPITMAGSGRGAAAVQAAADAEDSGASSCAAFSPHSPLGCSPCGSSGGGGGGVPGTGRRAKRNNRRQFEDCMAALPGSAAS